MHINPPRWVKVQDLVWNITFKFTFTDVHTDRGLDTVCFQAGGGERFSSSGSRKNTQMRVTRNEILYTKLVTSVANGDDGDEEKNPLRYEEVKKARLYMNNLGPQ
jgi:hypothetical protein